jgi:hypothetical protein
MKPSLSATGEQHSDRETTYSPSVTLNTKGPECDDYISWRSVIPDPRYNQDTGN